MERSQAIPRRRPHRAGPAKARPGKSADATILDVAALAEVSIATVSRVVNGFQRILPRTRKRVEEAIATLAYRPNVHARRLVTQSVDTICFLLSNREFLNPFHAGVLTGIEQVAAHLKLEVLYTTYRYSPDTPADHLDLPPILDRTGAIGGLVLAGTNYPNMMRAVGQRGIPHVLFGNNLVLAGRATHRSDAVYFDDEQGATDVVEYLLRLGHRRIAFAGDITQPWWQRRCAAYRRVMRRHHLPLFEYIRPLEQALPYGADAARYFLKRATPPTAVFAGNDLIAAGIWRECRSRQISVPGDLSLVGFDDLQVATLMDPALTTVQAPVEAVGQECMRMIVEKMRQPQVLLPQRMLATRMIIRESCAPPGTR